MKQVYLSLSPFFTGKIPHAEIPQHVAAMDIGVMPESNLFGSQMKIYEYMAAGLPLVTAALPPLDTIIREGQ